MNREQRLAGVRTIFLSGTFEHTVARDALARGADEWLVKGVHGVNHIMATVARLYPGPAR